MKTLKRPKNFISLIIKGMGMGAANVIPGVSGGTIALITGIFEPLIHALKSFNLEALKLLFTGQWKKLAEHIQLEFLIAVFLGIGISIFSLAKLLEYLFDNYPVLVWAFFFGLIMASVYYVGKTIGKWNPTILINFIVGTGIALMITFFKPAQENSQLYYLLLCGVVAVCSMILPGLSGSFVLVLMGNYRLVMIDAVSDVNLGILIPVIIGAVVGLLAFSHLLSWIFKKFRDQTIALLTGFMLGSLLILWPWKDEVFSTDEVGNLMLSRSGEPLLEGYRFLIPDFSNTETWIAMLCIVVGFLTILFIELLARKNNTE
jgi:putative membrane protein